LYTPFCSKRRDALLLFCCFTAPAFLLIPDKLLFFPYMPLPFNMGPLFLPFFTVLPIRGSRPVVLFFFLTFPCSLFFRRVGLQMTAPPPLSPSPHTTSMTRDYLFSASHTLSPYLSMLFPQSRLSFFFFRGHSIKYCLFSPGPGFAHPLLFSFCYQRRQHRRH